MRGIAPTTPEVVAILRSTQSPRWSVNMGTALNTSTLPFRSSGQIFCLALLIS